jgi:hypothetical protein
LEFVRKWCVNRRINQGSCVTPSSWLRGHALTCSSVQLQPKRMAGCCRTVEHWMKSQQKFKHPSSFLPLCRKEFEAIGGCLCVCFCTPATPAREPPSGFFFGRWQHMQYILVNKAMFLDSWGASISARGARWSACFCHFVDKQASWASRAGPPHKTRPWHGAQAALTAPPTQTLVPDIL